MRLNRYTSYIRCIGHDDSETLKNILRTLGKAALHAEERITNVSETHYGEHIDEVRAEETMFIEDLLGCAYVAAQSYITLVTSRLIWLHSRIKRDGHCLTTIPGTKFALINAYSDTVPGTSYTQIRVILEFANYFKHHEEWPPKWKCDNNMNKNARKTIAIIRAVGAAENSSDNCRKGLTTLGIHRVSDVYTIANILVRWHANLTDAYKNELKSLIRL
jgi:hypothetical protein